MKTTFTTTALVAALLAASSSAALAQSANFTGPGLGVVVSAQQHRIDRDPAWTNDMGSNSTATALVGSWGFASGQHWVTTVGLDIGLGNTEYFRETASGITSTAKVKQHYALSVAPGYRLGNESLVYAKVALHSLAIDYEATNATAYARTHQGYGLGVGYAQALAKNIELRAELETIAYGWETTANNVKLAPRQNNLNFALVYKF